MKFVSILTLTITIHNSLGHDCEITKVFDNVGCFATIATFSTDFYDRTCEEYCIAPRNFKGIPLMKHTTQFKTNVTKTNEAIHWDYANGCEFVAKISSYDIKSCHDGSFNSEEDNRTSEHKHIELFASFAGNSVAFVEVDARNKMRIQILVRSTIHDREKFQLRDKLVDAFVARNYDRNSFHYVDREYCAFLGAFCDNSTYSKILDSNLEEYIRKGKFKNSAATGFATVEVFQGIAVVIVLFANQF